FSKKFQLLNERLMGAEGTRLDEDFLQMEKSVAVIQALLSELLARTTEFLQPNPAYRAKLSMLSTVSRLRGQGRGSGYPQTEGMLGDAMVRYGQQLGGASEFGTAPEVSRARELLDADVTRGFLDPLQEMERAELKDIRFQLKKVNGRRLDFDYKRRRRERLPAEEVQQAGEKFLSSKELAERSMFLLLHHDVRTNPGVLRGTLPDGTFLWAQPVSAGLSRSQPVSAASSASSSCSWIRSGTWRL
uniref:SH3-domain GRB2-like 3b n=1 Tax=Salarias fasciatus TaxID=181472 RepID=A0A672HF22_SALFA